MSKKPPPPLPKPGRVQVYKALYPYISQNDDELSFEEGETIYVLETCTNGWWKARSSLGVSGYVPNNYIELKTESIDNPLHNHAKRGNVELLKEGIANNVNVNSLDKSGSTPLYWASHSGFLECVEILLAVKGIQINAQNKMGDTPLHAASWKGRNEVVQKLLENGADKNLKNNDKKTAFELAEGRHPLCASILKEAVYDIDITSYSVCRDGYGLDFEKLGLH